MCMVIDANTIPCVFSKDNQTHSDFQPLLRWLLYGKAKMSLGGKLFTKEIMEKQSSYVPFLMELKKVNKIHFINNEQIVAKEDEIKKIETSSDFDDSHIIALLIISRAKILCSNDARLFKFVKKIRKYDSSAEAPRIYTTIKHEPHKELLCDDNICSYGEHKCLSKSLADLIWNAIEKNN